MKKNVVPTLTLSLSPSLPPSLPKGTHLFEPIERVTQAFHRPFFFFGPRFEGFLSQQYGAPVAPETLLATSGASMGADLCIRAHAKALRGLEAVQLRLSFCVLFVCASWGIPMPRNSLAFWFSRRVWHCMVE